MPWIPGLELRPGTGDQPGRPARGSARNISRPAMIHRRHLTFWIVTLVVFALLLWLLSEILLPFVAGLALAYLQTPLADRLERRGINRTVAALMIVGGVVLVLIMLGLLLVPI